jgi:flavin reductase (DIM6/NTAB) family NADH-FMN oxidoreductase RutF
MSYLEIPPKEAYSLLNCGGLILVCTRSSAGCYDLAPIAWSCPLDYEPVSRVLFVCDTGHATYENILGSKEFAIALPAFAQREMAMRSGASSGRDADKYEALGIKAFRAREVDAQIPEGVAAWLECRLLDTVQKGTSSIVMGEVLAASAIPDAWRERLHFVSESLSYRPGELLG